MQIRNLGVALAFIFCGFTSDMNPSFLLKCSGGISDFVDSGNRLIVATENGLIEIYDITTKKQTGQIKLPPIKDFTGTLTSPNIYSVDISPSMHSILVAAEGWHGFTDLYLIADENRQHIFDAEKDKLSVREARFTKENEILTGLLSNELILFNISERKIIYRKQINTSSFSDLQLNDNHDQVIISDESGVISRVKISNGTIIRQYSGLIYDKVFQSDFKSGKILAGSQDRRVAVYKAETGTGYFRVAEFPVYCVALNADGSLGAYATPEESRVFVFETENHANFYTLNMGGSTITGIRFITKKKIVASGEDGKIAFWDLP